MITKQPKIKFLLLAIFMIAGSLTFAQKSIQLSYKLESGQQHELLIHTQQNIQMEMMGQEMEIVQDISTFQDVVVKEVDGDGNHTLQYTYTRIKLDQSAMGMDISFDSDTAEDDANPIVQQIAASMKQVIGKTIQITIDKLGNQLGNNISEVMTGETSVQGAETGMMTIFPEKKIKKGDTWEVDNPVEVNSDIVIRNTYTLNEIKDNQAHISFTGVVSGSKISGTDAKVEGAVEGTAVVDIATGWTQSASIQQNMTMVMEEQGVTMPMKMRSSTTFSSKKVF